MCICFDASDSCHGNRNSEWRAAPYIVYCSSNMSYITATMIPRLLQQRIYIAATQLNGTCNSE